MANSLLAQARAQFDDPGVRGRCLRDPEVWCAMLDAVVERLLRYLEERHEAGRAPQVAPDVTSTDAMLDAAAMAPSGEVLDLDALQKLCDRASSGPWESDERGDIFDEDGELMFTRYFMPGGAKDGAFVAAARDAVPKLIAEVRRLRTKLDNVFDDSPAEEFNHAF